MRTPVDPAVPATKPFRAIDRSIHTEVIDELALAAGVGEVVSAITRAAMNGEIDFNQSLIRRVALLKDLEESVLEVEEGRLTGRV